MPWLVVAQNQASILTSWLPGSKDYTFYLRTGEINQVVLTVETESLKGGEYTANIIIDPDGSDRQHVPITITVNVDALLNPARHQSAAASEIVCRKILAVEPDRPQVKFMLAKAITELGLQLLQHKPKQAAGYAQEAHDLLAAVNQATTGLEATPAEISVVRRQLTKLQTGLDNNTL